MDPGRKGDPWGGGGKNIISYYVYLFYQKAYLDCNFINSGLEAGAPNRKNLCFPRII